MEIKRPTPFVPFNSGFCVVTSDEGETKFSRLAFSDQTMGIKRFFSAKMAQTKIDRVIKVPKVQGLSQYDEVYIGGEKYLVEMIQSADDTNPPSITLTLRFLEVLQ